MKSNRITTTSTLPRRAFLRGVGATMALPWLESIATVSARGQSDAAESPRRMLLISNNLGVLCNLFVSMLQQLGIETDGFGSSSGTLTGA